MFTLWYTVLSWREYKDIIWEKLGTQKQQQSPKEPISCPLPAKTPSTVVQKPTPPPPPPPASSAGKSDTLPASPVAPNKPLQPPPKPPRSPSPHPNRNEVFEPDVEFEEEESEDEEEEEDEEENSVIDSHTNSINKDFLKKEIANQQKSTGASNNRR